MDLGIQLSDEAVNDHAAYLQSWISVLENDPNELFRAVHNASEISDYLIENTAELYRNVSVMPVVKKKPELLEAS